MYKCSQCGKEFELQAAMLACRESHGCSCGHQRVFSMMSGVTGISYREWLIGQIASGLASNRPSGDDGAFAGVCIGTADRIVAKLDAEKK